MHYIGVDHHKQYSHLTVLDEDGSAVEKLGMGVKIAHPQQVKAVACDSGSLSARKG